MDEGESFTDAVIREVKEETGLTIFSPKLCDINQFTHSKGSYRYIVFFYKTSQFSGQLRSSDEGEVFWLERADLAKHQLADGFAEMLPIFEDDQLSELYFYYDNDEWHSEQL